MGLRGNAFGIAFVVSAASFAAADDGDIRVVVGFKGDADASVLAAHNVTVGDGDVHDGFAVVVVSAKKAAKLRADPAVAYVEEDAVAEALGKPGSGGTVTPPPQPDQTTPGGITTVWGSASAPTTTGAGVKVAVIDTGIDYDHPDLAANVKGNTTFVSRTTTGKDDNGHGSHVAGIIAAGQNTIGVVGVAPEASLYAVKVLDKRGSGYVSDVAAGIKWAADHGMNVANMSLGASSGTTALQNACDDAASRGVLLVAAAGNSGDSNTSTTELSYPAAYSSVVAVGAIDSSDGLAYFSNSGSFVEVSAPGVGIFSTYKGGTYATLSGTSMASPHAAGVAALIWASTASPTVGDVRAALDSRVRDLGPTGRDNGFGYGCVDFAIP